MDLTEQLKTWGAAHAKARAAERTAEQAGPTDDTGDLQRRARSLREEADQLHRDVYRSLDRRERD